MDENENVVSSESCDRVLSRGTLLVVAGRYFVFRFGKGRVALVVEVDVTALNGFFAREGSDATLRPSCPACEGGKGPETERSALFRLFLLFWNYLDQHFTLCIPYHRCSRSKGECHTGWDKCQMNVAK